MTVYSILKRDFEGMRLWEKGMSKAEIKEFLRKRAKNRRMAKMAILCGDGLALTNNKKRVKCQ